MALAGGVAACSLALDLGSLDEGCPVDTKLCNGTCVPLDDPKTGCGPLRTCAPCALYNAKSYSCRSDTNECFVTACLDGFDDCQARATGNAILQNCRTNLNEDPLNCRECGHECPPLPHAEPACGGGECYTLCQFGYGDCDGLRDNGCETELRSNVADCGACQYSCVGKSHMTGDCVNGACLCAAGFADCNRVATDGCEADLSTTSNCGACGVVCAEGQICTAGVCVTP
jgi:hypothetical protein